MERWLDIDEPYKQKPRRKVRHHGRRSVKPSKLKRRFQPLRFLEDEDIVGFDCRWCGLCSCCCKCQQAESRRIEVAMINGKYYTFMNINGEIFSFFENDEDTIS